MKTKVISRIFRLNALVIAAAFVSNVAIAQNNALVLNGAYVTMNGGTSSTSLFLVVNQSNIAGISRNSGHIISENQYNYIRWIAGTGTGNYVYPFGYSTTDYLPVTLNKTTAGSSTIDASTWGTDNKNLPHAGVSDGGTLAAPYKMKGVGDSISSVIDRWWDFYPSAPITANITFSYRGVENATTTNTGDNLDMQHWNGTKWDTPFPGSTTGVTSGVGTISVTGVTSFSPMVVIHRSGPLPVTISKFNTTCVDGGVKIAWTTSSENNSDYFKLERSEDGATFESVATVRAAGKSTTPKDYEFIDTHSTNANYYRLSEKDFNGTSSYNRTIFSQCEFSDELSVHVYPNPVADILNYEIFSFNKENIFIEIYDETGRIMIREHYTVDQGVSSTTTDISRLCDGFYYAKINLGRKSFLKKFIKIGR